jgi:hypothetical protein
MRAGSPTPSPRVPESLAALPAPTPADRREQLQSPLFKIMRSIMNFLCHLEQK